VATELSVPEAPDPLPEEIWSGTPNVVLDGERYAIGWQHFPDGKGGPAYVTARRGILGGRRILERYPLTADGWARAWRDYAERAPATAERTRLALGRFYAARPPAGMLAIVPGLILTAIDPPADGFAVGQAYDLRFDADGMRITRSGSPEATAEYRYSDVTAVWPTRLEQVLTLSRMEHFLVRGMTRPDDYEYRTHLRVQTSDRTLDFWLAATPAGNYRWLEPINGAIRQAWLLAAAAKAERHSEWLVTELSRLAERLDRGALTRSDIELLKAKISSGS
jgi:hypothetical protein